MTAMTTDEKLEVTRKVLGLLSEATYPDALSVLRAAGELLGEDSKERSRQANKLGRAG